MNTARHSLWSVFLPQLLFLLGVGIALWFWPYVQIQFNNPWEVNGMLARLRFNPINNALRFALVIALPVVLLLLVYLLTTPHAKSTLFCSTPSPFMGQVSLRKNRFALFGLIMYSILMGLYTPTYRASGFDLFHDGESVGTEVSYAAGQVPYRDFVIAHGVFQDPLRARVAFSLFGRSIGGLHTLSSLIQIALFILISVGLVVALRGNVAASLLVFMLVFLRRGGVGESNGLILLGRDITLAVFVIVSLLFVRSIKNHIEGGAGWRTFFASAGFTFVPVASFAYSVDRGVYLLLAMVVMAALVMGTGPRIRTMVVCLAGATAGLTLAVLVLGCALRWAFGAFIDYALVKMPRYWDLMDGMVYRVAEWRHLVVCVGLAGIAFWVAYRVMCEHQRVRISVLLTTVLAKYDVEVLLAVLALVFIRSALGRSGIDQLFYSLLPAWLFAGVVLVRHYVWPLLTACRLRRFATRAIWAVALVSACVMVKPFFASAAWVRKFPFTARDENLPVYGPGQVWDAVTFLRSKLASGDSFYSLTSEASWFYLLDRMSPTRFPVAWHAAPCFYQDEVTRDLARKHVSYVILVERGIDGLTLEEQLPRIAAYVKQDYAPLQRFGPYEIWERKAIRRAPSQEPKADL